MTTSELAFLQMVLTELTPDELRSALQSSLVERAKHGDVQSPQSPVDEFQVPWAADPGYFQSGEPVEVHSFGRWYPGSVTRVGRSRIHVWYRTGSGKERVKAFSPSLVRPVRKAEGGK
jgi:hypothetical protein